MSVCLKQTKKRESVACKLKPKNNHNLSFWIAHKIESLFSLELVSKASLEVICIGNTHHHNMTFYNYGE